jgi:hypothetical protein
VTDEEFTTFLADAVEELQAKQDALRAKYGLGERERFVVDFEAGTLTFFDQEKPAVEAAIMPLATHVPDRNSLKWAWANEALPAEVRQKASAVKDLYRLTGFEIFRNEYVECDEAMAWEITALACKFFCKIGAYRIPSSNAQGYVLMKEVKWYSQAG